jgi:hypothetical protein
MSGWGGVGGGGLREDIPPSGQDGVRAVGFIAGRSRWVRKLIHLVSLVPFFPTPT